MEKILYGPITLKPTFEDRIADKFWQDPAHALRQVGMCLVIVVCVAANLI